MFTFDMQPPDIVLTGLRHETWPIRGGFTISRGGKRAAEVVVATVTACLPDGRRVQGRGECTPYARYGETVASVMADIAGFSGRLDRATLQRDMPAGAARSALDCALWDVEAKAAGAPAWRLAGLEAAPEPVATCFTISLGRPEAMGAAAEAAAGLPLLKLKLGGGPDDIDRVRAVRKAAPDARLIVDANEGWTFDILQSLAPALARLGVLMIEQPLPAGQDGALAGYACPAPLGADESCHGLESLAALRGRYQMVNIKLDKTGGLSHALAMKQAARQAGFGIMIGCMVATSLAMAPAFLLTEGADFVDLDGPLLLERDRAPGIAYHDAWMQPPPAALWG